MKTTRGPHETSALIAAVAAFMTWGLVPVYWKLLRFIPATEILVLTPPSSAAKITAPESRGLVQTDDNVMIGGSIIGGGLGQATVIARGIGPSLTAGGVANAPQDPTLELHHNCILAASNDN